MVGGSSRSDAGATTHRHRYRTLPASDMADNDGLKVSQVGDVISDEEERVKQGWWTRERFVSKSPAPTLEIRSRSTNRSHFSVILELCSSTLAVSSCQLFTGPSRNYG